MKALKKLFCGMLSVALFATLFAAPAFAADSTGAADGQNIGKATTQEQGQSTGQAQSQTQGQSGSYVFDEYGVLSASEFQALEQKGAAYAQQYGIGVYVVFTDMMNGNYNPTGSERNEFGRQFFLNHSLGVGSGKNGIIMCVAVDSRDYVTVKHFNDSSQDPFSNECVDALEDEYVSYLSNNNWYGAANAYYRVAGEQMEYFAATGRQWTEPDPISLLIKILATLGIPFAVAASVVRGEKSAMLTAREQSEASNYLNRDSLRMTKQNDVFVNTTMSVVPLPDDDRDSGGGGGWSDMGGGFSGSGGGKF